MHASIPTTYRGIRFRSRLEAKYACLFDLLGWSWEYEPLDLNGWIPDFVLRTPLFQKHVLAEVKPHTTPEKEETNKIYHAFGANPDAKDRKKTRLADAAMAVEWDAETDVYLKSSDCTCSDATILATMAKLENAKKATRAALLALPSNTWKKTLQYDILFLGLYPYKTVSGRHLLGYHLDVPSWEPVFYDSDMLDAAWARATNTIQWKAPA